MTDQELKDLVASLAVSQYKTDAQLAETDAQLAKTDEQLAKTDAKLNRLADMYGGLSENIGNFAEETFLNALIKNPTIMGIKFEEISSHWKKRSGKVEGEFDIVLVNGDRTAVVEVKHRLGSEDILKFAEKKHKNFKILFPDYQDKKIYGGVAGLSFAPEAKETAERLGFFVLALEGQELKVFGSNIKAY